MTQSAEVGATAHDIVRGWPTHSKRVGLALLRWYDQPSERTPTLLRWHFNGPWKQTLLFRDGARHNFPRPHRDILAQTVYYRVPVEKCADVVAFNGSLLIDRTGGELTARCDTEAMNFLVLNLAHDIVVGTKTVDQARAVCTRVAQFRRFNWPEPYTQGLQFSPTLRGVEPEHRTPDPDRALASLVPRL